MRPYFKAMFFKFQCRFRKGFNTKHCLLLIIEKWQEVLDNDGETSTVLTNLSKGFDFINHNIQKAKLNAYGVEKRSLDFTHVYLTKLKQRTKIESSFSP